MEQKVYTAKELNAILGYEDLKGNKSAPRDLISRCKNAGLIVEIYGQRVQGVACKYIIKEDNFHKDNEFWIQCAQHELYEVSNLGRIRRKDTKKLIGNQNTNNYIEIRTIDKNGNQRHFNAHRLIYFSFHPEQLQYEKSLQIDHINGIRNDNRIENLQALTNVKNVKKRDEEQTQIKLLTTQLILKYGYEETKKFLQNLLDKQ